MARHVRSFRSGSGSSGGRAASVRRGVRLESLTHVGRALAAGAQHPQWARTRVHGRAGRSPRRGSSAPQRTESMKSRVAGSVAVRETGWIGIRRWIAASSHQAAEATIDHGLPSSGCANKAGRQLQEVSFEFFWDCSRRHCANRRACVASGDASPAGPSVPGTRRSAATSWSCPGSTRAQRLAHARRDRTRRRGYRPDGRAGSTVPGHALGRVAEGLLRLRRSTCGAAIWW